MKQSKKAQLTIYIILAVLIVTIFIALYFRPEAQSESFADMQGEDFLAQASATARDCLEASLTDVLEDLGDSGRIDMQHPIQLYNGMVETMSIAGEPLLPNMDQLAAEAGERLNYVVEECIEQKWAVQPPTLETSLGVVVTQIHFTESHAVASARIPITIKVAGKLFSTDGFTSSLPVRFPTIYRTVQTLVSLSQEDPLRVSPELLLAQPVKVNIETIDKSSYVYVLEDDHSLLEGGPYGYRFAVIALGVQK